MKWFAAADANVGQGDQRRGAFCFEVLQDDIGRGQWKLKLALRSCHRAAIIVFGEVAHSIFSQLLSEWEGNVGRGQLLGLVCFHLPAVQSFVSILNVDADLILDLSRALGEVVQQNA